MSFFNEIQRGLRKKNISFTGTHIPKPLSSLHENEKNHISSAIHKRQIEFATGRWCAREALKKINIEDIALSPGSAGNPIWPSGICGSITHSNGAYCAAVSKKDHNTAIGIDVENHQRIISPKALGYILNHDEYKWLEKTAQRKKIEMLIFSAKEAFFKMVYPIVKKQFYFDKVSVLPVKNTGEFSIVLNSDLGKSFRKGSIFNGYYFLNSSWILTVMWL